MSFNLIRKQPDRPRPALSFTGRVCARQRPSRQRLAGGSSRWPRCEALSTSRPLERSQPRRQCPVPARYRREPLPKEYVHLLETLCACAFDDHFRCAHTREMHGGTSPHQHAVAGVGDPERSQFTEAARNLAQRMIKEGGQPRRNALLRLSPRGRPPTEAHRGKHSVAAYNEELRISRRTRKPPTSSLMWANPSVTKTSTMLSTRLGPLWPACS